MAALGDIIDDGSDDSDDDDSEVDSDMAGDLSEEDEEVDDAQAHSRFLEQISEGLTGKPVRKRHKQDRAEHGEVHAPPLSLPFVTLYTRTHTHIYSHLYTSPFSNTHTLSFSLALLSLALSLSHSLSLSLCLSLPLIVSPLKHSFRRYLCSLTSIIAQEYPPSAKLVRQHLRVADRPCSGVRVQRAQRRRRGHGGPVGFARRHV